MSQLLDRVEALHTKAGMPWSEAERLALLEAGIDDADIDELVGNASGHAIVTLLDDEEVREFARSVLVHGAALFNTNGNRPAPEGETR